MGKTLIHTMDCGCEFWVGLNTEGIEYPDLQRCELHDYPPALWSYLVDGICAYCKKPITDKKPYHRECYEKLMDELNDIF